MPGGYHANMKAWEPEEDDIIIEMLSTKGPRWKTIAKSLPGRTVRKRAMIKRNVAARDCPPSPLLA